MCDDSSVNDAVTATSELKTKLTRVVAKLIGNSPDLMKFDKAGYLAKQCKTQSATEAHTHTHTQSEIDTHTHTHRGTVKQIHTQTQTHTHVHVHK